MNSKRETPHVLLGGFGFTHSRRAAMRCSRRRAICHAPARATALKAVLKPGPRIPFGLRPQASKGAHLSLAKFSCLLRIGMIGKKNMATTKGRSGQVWQCLGSHPLPEDSLFECPEGRLKRDSSGKVRHPKEALLRSCTKHSPWLSPGS